MDVGYERRLANHLGAHRTPSILGVINGKVTFFHYAVAKEHLRQFVEDLLPQRLVERVNIRILVKNIIFYVWLNLLMHIQGLFLM